MIFDDATITRLLGSIEANRLVILCGAGLSIPSPSDLMSAVRVSQFCYDKYQPITPLPVAMRDDVDQLAGHFHSAGEFESIFINTLVPWNELVGRPNSGHAAIADLLITGAADAVLSANFDTLIEQWAWDRKMAMRGALDGHEATGFSATGSPLVKFHGCHIRNREETLWTQGQLAEANVAARVTTCSNWMGLELPGKDLLVVGFWTDWGYLNDVLANAIGIAAFGSVTVIDTASAASLQAKAPTLWAKLNNGTTSFLHVQASGAAALAELRDAFSKVWLKKFYALGRPLLEEAGKPYVAIEPVMSCDDLYNCRRDVEGRPYDRAAQMKEPKPEAKLASFCHHLLIQAGATHDGAWYRHGGRRIRVVQGAGDSLISVRERYREPPALDHPDVVVCAGASDLRVPGNQMSPGVGSSIVRPSGGAGARWITLEQARGELAI